MPARVVINPNAAIQPETASANPGPSLLVACARYYSNTVPQWPPPPGTRALQKLSPRETAFGIKQRGLDLFGEALRIKVECYDIVSAGPNEKDDEIPCHLGAGSWAAGDFLFHPVEDG